MATVLLQDGTIWVHSPVALDSPLQAALRGMGEVRHIVTPNTEHQKYAADWIRAFPEATSYACPGLRERKPEVGWDETIGASVTTGDHPVWSDVCPPAWNDEFHVCWMDAERGPFMDRPFFSEVVFCHRPSRTLIVSDLWWNYPGDSEATPRGTRLWKAAMDKIYAPFYNTFMQQHPTFHSRLQLILSWDWDAIMPCHGFPVTEDAKGVLARHLGFR